MVAGDVLIFGLALFSFICLAGIFLFFFKHVLSLIKALIVNSVVGLVVAFLLGIIGIKIPLTTATIVVLALFGLGGLGTLLTLMFFGINLAPLPVVPPEVIANATVNATA